MGEGLYVSLDESNGGESPKKRARTSLSDHGIFLPPLGSYVIEMDTASGSTAPSTPPSKEDQLSIIKNSILARLELQSTVYLIPTKWFDALNVWGRSHGQSPGRVDPERTLCDEYGVLLEDALESRDWLATNEQGWDLIKRWYKSHCSCFWRIVLTSSHGADSEVARKVIPISPTSLQGVIELYPPEIVLTRIRPMTSSAFNFSAGSSSDTVSITVSKSDTLDILDSKIRRALSLLSTGDIRCYRFPVARLGTVRSELTPAQAAALLSDPPESLDFSLKSQTVGEIGIVQPYLGLAVEWKQLGGTWPMDELNSERSSGPIDMPRAGRTLGAEPNSLSQLQLSLTHQRRVSDDKSPFDDSDDDPPLGKINGQAVLGPVLPGSYPRDSPPNSVLRSSSAERFVERYKPSFNSRFSIQSPKEERVLGTTGLNNLGTLPFANQC